MATLRIMFRCLCFFVRDEERGEMHVLTPATCGGCSSGGIPQHEAFLMFPKEGGSLNTVGHFRKPGEPGKNDFVKMEDFALFLPSNGSSAVLKFDQSIVDLNSITADTVAPLLARGPRDVRISSRVTLRSGRMVEPEAPGNWDFGGQPEIPLARDVSWIVEGLRDEPLELRVSRFGKGQQPNPAGDVEVARIAPNADGEFLLQFHHGLRGDFGRKLEDRFPEEAVRHFRAYYGLFDQPAATPLPKFVKSEDEGTVGCIISGGTVRP